MKVVTNVYYTGRSGSAKAFVDEVISSGLVKEIKAEKGCLKYEYFVSVTNPDTVLLVQEWESNEDFNTHLNGASVVNIVELRKKHGIAMRKRTFIEE